MDGCTGFPLDFPDCSCRPVGDHRLNPAECAIQTFKNPFNGILIGTDSDFPPHLWCCLIKQSCYDTKHICCAYPVLTALRVASDHSPPPRAETVQPPRVVSPPVASPKKLLLHLKAGPYWDKPVVAARHTQLAMPTQSMQCLNGSLSNGLTTNHTSYKLMRPATRVPRIPTTIAPVHIASPTTSISLTP